MNWKKAQLQPDHLKPKISILKKNNRCVRKVFYLVFQVSWLEAGRQCAAGIKKMRDDRGTAYQQLGFYLRGRR